MNFNQLLDQFIGSAGSNSGQTTSHHSETKSPSGSLGSALPGGLAGGAAAGGIVALFMGNKKARKFAGKAARYGGAALLGGVALKAYQNWQQQPSAPSQSSPQIHTNTNTRQNFHQQALAGRNSEAPFETTLIRAMIAASRADGHIDSEEQQRIFAAVDKMNLSSEHKGVIFDSLQQDFTVHQLAEEIQNDEQKMEIYLASCLVTDISDEAVRAHLDSLAITLQLPDTLCRELEKQASLAYEDVV